jgi:hypothetical protein
MPERGIIKPNWKQRFETYYDSKGTRYDYADHEADFIDQNYKFVEQNHGLDAQEYICLHKKSFNI